MTTSNDKNKKIVENGEKVVNTEQHTDSNPRKNVTDNKKLDKHSFDKITDKRTKYL